MRLVDYLDKGASLGPDRPCLTTDGSSLSYAEVVDLSHRIAAALVARGVTPGGKVAILSANDPIAFSCLFGLSRAGAAWCPINPRNEAAGNRELLDLFDCEVVIFQGAFAPRVGRIRPERPRVHTWGCLDHTPRHSGGGADFLAGWAESGGAESVGDAAYVADLAAIVGTGGTTGRPKGVMLTGTNLETMTALT